MSVLSHEHLTHRCAGACSTSSGAVHSHCASVDSLIAIGCIVVAATFSDTVQLGLGAAGAVIWVGSRFATRLAVRLLGFSAGAGCAHTSLPKRHGAAINATTATVAPVASSRARARIGAGRRGNGVVSRFLTAVSRRLHATEPMFFQKRRVLSKSEQNMSSEAHIGEVLSVFSPTWTISALVTERLSRLLHQRPAACLPLCIRPRRPTARRAPRTYAVRTRTHCHTVRS